MDETWGHYAKRNKPVTERYSKYFFKLYATYFNKKKFASI